MEIHNKIYELPQISAVFEKNNSYDIYYGLGNIFVKETRPYEKWFKDLLKRIF